MSASEETLTLLKSIDASLKTLVALSQKRQARAASSAPKAIADDADLDGQHGDPVLKFKPRDWTGGDYKNARFSQCPPELLDLVAASLDYFAEKAEQEGKTTANGKPVAPYNRRDAARARGWARRMRDGKCTTPAASLPNAVPETVPADWAPAGWD